VGVWGGAGAVGGGTHGGVGLRLVGAPLTLECGAVWIVWLPQLSPPPGQARFEAELFQRASPKYPLTSLRPRPYVAVPRSAPVPGGPSRYRTTLSTPGVLPEEFRSMAQPHTTSVPSKTVEFAAGPSTYPIGSEGYG